MIAKILNLVKKQSEYCKALSCICPHGDNVNIVKIARNPRTIEKINYICNRNCLFITMIQRRTYIDRNYCFMNVYPWREICTDEENCRIYVCIGNCSRFNL